MLDLSGGGGWFNTFLVPLNPQVCIDPRKIVKISQKCIADPPSGFPTNRVLREYSIQLRRGGADCDGSDIKRHAFRLYRCENEV